jgi:HEPN domain-containing protein
VQKAEEDYHVAVNTHRGGGRFHSTVCFRCQQAVEKYLKALMEESGLNVPKTHDLFRLRTLLIPHYSRLPAPRGLRFLTPFAIETRYPGERARKRDAEAALRWAGKSRALARSLLGLSAT